MGSRNGVTTRRRSVLLVVTRAFGTGLPFAPAIVGSSPQMVLFKDVFFLFVSQSIVEKLPAKKKGKKMATVKVTKLKIMTWRKG